MKTKGLSISSANILLDSGKIACVCSYSGLGLVGIEEQHHHGSPQSEHQNRYQMEAKRQHNRPAQAPTVTRTDTIDKGSHHFSLQGYLECVNQTGRQDPQCQPRICYEWPDHFKIICQ
jgi:hypothetical protein